VPPVLSKSSHQAASSSIPDDWIFGTIRLAPPARPRSFDGAAGPSRVSEFVSGPNRTTPAPPLPFQPCPRAATPSVRTHEPVYGTKKSRPSALTEPHKHYLLAAASISRSDVLDTGRNGLPASPVSPECYLQDINGTEMTNRLHRLDDLLLLSLPYNLLLRQVPLPHRARV
ncbi:hypothetical protein CPB97_001979, partial [Podila verticillata]